VPLPEECIVGLAGFTVRTPELGNEVQVTTEPAFTLDGIEE